MRNQRGYDLGADDVALGVVAGGGDVFDMAYDPANEQIGNIAHFNMGISGKEGLPSKLFARQNHLQLNGCFTIIAL
jgi:hypothetical protein